jgi:hypothetical protein
VSCRVGLAAPCRTSHTRKHRSLSPAKVANRCGLDGSQRTWRYSTAKWF